MHCLPQHLAFKDAVLAIDILSVKKKEKKNKGREKTKKNYLDEFVNMAIRHLMRRSSRNLLQFIWSNNLIRQGKGHLSISPDVGTYLPLALLTHLALLVMRADLLNR